MANGDRLILNNTAAFVKSWNLFWSMTSTSKPAHPGYVDLAAAGSKPLKKKIHVVMEQVQELRGKFMSACRKNFTHTVKRCRKPVLRQKLTKNLAKAGCLYRLRKTIAKILQKAFNSCPTTTVCCESSQLTLTVLSGDNEKKSPTENKQSIVGTESASNLNY